MSNRRFLASWHRRLLRRRSNFRKLRKRWLRLRTQFGRDSLSPANHRRVSPPGSQAVSRHPHKADSPARASQVQTDNRVKDNQEVNRVKDNPAPNPVLDNRAKVSPVRNQVKDNQEQDNQARELRVKDSRARVNQVKVSPLKVSQARAGRDKARWLRRLSHFGRRRRCSIRRLNNSTLISRTERLSRVSRTDLPAVRPPGWATVREAISHRTLPDSTRI